MFEKKYKFIKAMLFAAFAFLCIVYLNNFVRFVLGIAKGLDTVLIFDYIHRLVILTIFLASSILFFKLMNDIEKKRFLYKNNNTSKTMSKLFLIGAISEFILNNITVDKTGIGFTGVEINILFIFFLYNYIIFTIIPYLIDISIEMYNDNKSII